MKKGKTSFLQGFKTAKIVYGTVDSINLKSLYLNIQTWVEPIYECDNWVRTVLNLSRSVKHSIYESINKQIFDEKFIVDLLGEMQRIYSDSLMRLGKLANPGLWIWIRIQFHS